MSEQKNENDPTKSPLKTREEIVADDFIGVETDVGKLVFGYLAGQVGNFLYIIDEMTLVNSDLSNIRTSSLVPEFVLYCNGMRAMNINNIRSYFTPSFPIRALYLHTINQMMESVKDKIETVKDSKSEGNQAPDVEFSIEDLIGDNKTVH